jgi:peptidoglycan hydrolase-like protein with peptidoglycan-binding domain
MSNIGSIGGGASRIDLTSGAGGADATTSAQAAEPVTLGSAELKANAALSQVASQGGTIGFGARGDAAKGMQEGLKKLGYLAGAADGIYGRGTQSAVADFQRKNGLDPTGNCDSKTLAALDRALQFGATKGSMSAAPRNEIVFMGMGDGAKNEVQDLKRRGVGVVGLTDTAVNDQVTFSVGGRMQTYDLTKESEVDRYVKDIGITGAKAKEVAAAISGAGDDARDEAAQVAKAFLEAEQGKRTIERLVLSGHSVGEGVWGDSNGYFEYDTLEKLTKAFPKAASQVEDFLVAGCYSMSPEHVERYRGMFPNVKTAMAYLHSAPGTWTGAMVHNAKWEELTRGHDPSKLDRAAFAGTRKGENIGSWNTIGGLKTDEPVKPLAELRTRLAQQEPGVRDYFSGNKTITDTQTGPMREYYSTIQQMLGSPELPASERPRMEQLRDATIRTIFYDATVKGKFQAAYKDKINAGFAALGMTPAPDFGKLSRKDALAKVAEFEQKLAAKNPKPQAALTLKPLLTDGIRDLKQSVIPNTWV